MIIASTFSRSVSTLRKSPCLTSHVTGLRGSDFSCSRPRRVRSAREYVIRPLRTADARSGCCSTRIARSTVLVETPTRRAERVAVFLMASFEAIPWDGHA